MVKPTLLIAALCALGRGNAQQMTCAELKAAYRNATCSVSPCEMPCAGYLDEMSLPEVCGNETMVLSNHSVVDAVSFATEMKYSKCPSFCWREVNILAQTGCLATMAGGCVNPWCAGHIHNMTTLCIGDPLTMDFFEEKVPAAQWAERICQPCVVEMLQASTEEHCLHDNLCTPYCQDTFSRIAADCQGVFPPGDGESVGMRAERHFEHPACSAPRPPRCVSIPVEVAYSLRAQKCNSTEFYTSNHSGNHSGNYSYSGGYGGGYSGGYGGGYSGGYSGGSSNDTADGYTGGYSGGYSGGYP